LSGARELLVRAYLFSTPAVQIRDFWVRAALDAAYTDGELNVSAAVRNLGENAVSGHRLSVELFDAGSKSLFPPASRSVSIPAGGEARIEIRQSVQRPAHWTAETPNLYSAVLTLTDERGKVLEAVAHRVGFRNVGVRAGQLLVNGVPIYIKGVNRHEHDAVSGRVMTEELMRQDFRLRKTGTKQMYAGSL
jgi:beta-galactosidase